jgi:hypothetical protein
MAKDWLPKNHDELMDQATLTWQFISTEPDRSRMGFGPATQQGVWLDSEFHPKYTALTTVYPAWKNPATRTSITTLALEDAETAFKPVYRQLYNGLLKGNPFVTNEDLVSMGLPARSGGGKHPSPVPNTIPGSDANTATPRRVTIIFYDDTGAHKKAKPAGVHCVECRWSVFDTRELPTLDQLIHSSVDTNSPLTLEFSDEQRGKFLCYALRWENTRGEKGPFGSIQQAVIP